MTTTPTQIPLDAALAARARDTGASLRRLALTTAIVTSFAAVALGLAYRQLQVSEASFAPSLAEGAGDASGMGSRNPVSRYALHPLRADGSKIEARFWVGTPNEYAVHAYRGVRTEKLASFEPGLGMTEGMRNVRWRFVDSDGNPLPESSYVNTEPYGPWTFETFEEPCPGGTTTSWKLCPQQRYAYECILAPEPSACWQGPLRLVELYGAGDTLWAVVEREMETRTARMVAGVKLRLE